MSESLIVALVILVGVFIIMVVTILKAGHEAAIKMWGVMGALTGVTFGAITTFYFTDQVRKREVAAVEAEAEGLKFALTQATQNALAASKLVTPFYIALSEKGSVSASMPETMKFANSLSDGERDALAQYIKRTKDLLTQIQALKAQEPFNDLSEHPPELKKFGDQLNGPSSDQLKWPGSELK